LPDEAPLQAGQETDLVADPLPTDPMLENPPPSGSARVSTARAQPAWQRQDVASAFIDQRRSLIPLLDAQEDLIRRLLCLQERPVTHFVDVGGGDGAMSELVLAARPESEAVLVDFSTPMLERASVRLERFADRWRAVQGDLSDPAWREHLPGGRYDGAVSAFAIHHLRAPEKRRLFRELFELLEPGGMFVNMDFVLVDGPLQRVFDERMRANLVHAERARRANPSAASLEDDFAEQWNAHEDRPDTAEDQVRWLSRAGFTGAEVYFKWAGVAVFGAVKPA